MTRAFIEELRRRNPDPSGRRWDYLPYDQLSRDVGPLSREKPSERGVVLVECPAKAARRPYHRQKLARVLSSMGHFALELADAGIAVRYLTAKKGYEPTLRAAAKELGGLRMMRAAERELRHELAPLERAVVAAFGQILGSGAFDRDTGHRFSRFLASGLQVADTFRSHWLALQARLATMAPSRLPLLTLGPALAPWTTRPRMATGHPGCSAPSAASSSSTRSHSSTPRCACSRL